MPWVRIDDQFPQHPKIAAVGPLGMALQVAGLCYCNRYLTDGFIPLAVARTLLDFTGLGVSTQQEDIYGDGQPVTLADIATAEMVIQMLVSACIWETTPAGYQVHDFADYQPTKAQVEAERSAKVASGRAGGIAAALARAKAPAVAESKPNPVPVPVREEKEPLSTEVRKKRRKASPAPLAAAALMGLYSEDEQTEMNRLFPSIDLTWEAGKCVDWHNAKGGATNWKLAFKNWLGNAKPTNGGSNGRTPAPTNGETVRERKHREFLEEAERFARTGSPIDRQGHVPSVQPIAPN